MTASVRKHPDHFELWLFKRTLQFISCAEDWYDLDATALDDRFAISGECMQGADGDDDWQASMAFVAIMGRDATGAIVDTLDLRTAVAKHAEPDKAIEAAANALLEEMAVLLKSLRILLPSPKY